MYVVRDSASGDIIFLEGVEIYAYGGTTEAEREVGQRYRLDIAAEADLSRAASSDSLADTISYSELYEIATEVMTARKFSLLESQAERIAQALLSRTDARSVTVRLRKLVPPIEGTVAAGGVEIRRERP